MRFPVAIASILALTNFLTTPTIAKSTREEDSIEKFIADLFTYRISNFEFGEFNGRRDDRKSCQLVRNYFYGAIISNHESLSCRYHHSRFAPGPDGTPMEEVVTADGADDPPPRPVIQSIKVTGNQAQVDIIFIDANDINAHSRATGANRGRVIFFLEKLPQGWRIVNKLTFSQWPLELSGENSDCRMAHSKFNFAIRPKSDAYLLVLPKACQKFGMSQIEE